MDKQKAVLGTYHLPQWAINFINEEGETDFDQEQQLEEWIESLETSNGGVEVVVLDKKPSLNQSALFVSDNEPTFKVIITGWRSNVGKIKAYYATLGHKKFFEILNKAKLNTDTSSESTVHQGLVEAANSFPETDDLDEVICWSRFESQFRQIWVVIFLENAE